MTTCGSSYDVFPERGTHALLDDRVGVGEIDRVILVVEKKMETSCSISTGAIKVDVCTFHLDYHDLIIKFFIVFSPMSLSSFLIRL